MADNITLPGTASVVAADEIDSKYHQRVKVSIGADGAATDLAFGQGAMAASLPVAIASNQSAVAVTGPLTDTELRAAAVTIGGAAADDAAASGNPVPVGGVFQATADLVDDGDVGRVRMSARRTLYNATDYRLITLTSAAPAPAGTDLTNGASAAVAGTDLAIRDTNTHTIVIPLAVSGWRNLTVILLNGVAWVNTPTMTVQSAIGIVVAEAQAVTVGSWVLSKTQYHRCGFGNAGAVGVGGLTGASPASNATWFSIPALASMPYVWLQIKLDSAAAETGDVGLYIARST